MVQQEETFDEDDAKTKWQKLAPLLERMMERVGTEGEFPIATGSSLAGDDAAADPYQVSHVIRMCLTAGTDHLHAVKVLVVDQHVVHVAAPASLARGALETLAAAYWVLQPAQRDERVTRSLRWHAKNMRDAETAVGDLELPGHTPLEEKLSKLDAVAAKRSLDIKTVPRRLHKHRDREMAPRSTRRTCRSGWFSRGASARASPMVAHGPTLAFRTSMSRKRARATSLAFD
jgi:hypothetical protein